MSIISKPSLIEFFKRGKQPTQEQFQDLIDSCYGTNQTLEFNTTTNMLTIKGTSSANVTNPDSSVNLTPLKTVSLAYDETTNTLTIAPSGGATAAVLGPWKKNGTNTYYLTGNVGINTNSPTQKLEVNGNIKLSAADSKIFFKTAEITDISNDTTLAANSDNILATQKAIKAYIDARQVQNMFHAYAETYTGSDLTKAVQLEFISPTTATSETLTRFKFNGLLYSAYSAPSVKVFDLANEEFNVPTSAIYQFMLNMQISSYTVSSGGYIKIAMEVKLSNSTTPSYYNLWEVYGAAPEINRAVFATRELQLTVSAAITAKVRIVVKVFKATIVFTEDNSFVCKRYPSTGGGYDVDNGNRGGLDEFVDFREAAQFIGGAS